MAFEIAFPLHGKVCVFNSVEQRNALLKQMATTFVVTICHDEDEDDGNRREVPLTPGKS